MSPRCHRLGPILKLCHPFRLAVPALANEGFGVRSLSDKRAGVSQRSEWSRCGACIEGCGVSLEPSAVPRVGVFADSPCKVKGFTAQISGHTEGRCGKAGDPGGPCGLVTGETSDPRRHEQRKAHNSEGEVITRRVGRDSGGPRLAAGVLVDALHGRRPAV